MNKEKFQSLEKRSAKSSNPWKFWLWCALAMPLVASAQVTYYWRGDSAEGDGRNWSTANNWWRGYNEAPNGSEIIIFDNNHKTEVNTNNLAATSRYRLFFNSGASTARTITGSTENVFFDFGGNVPKIENNDSGTKTLAFPIGIGYNNSEINPVSGSLTLDRLDTRTHNINVYGNSGHTLTIRGELRGRGGLTVQQNSNVQITGTPTNQGTMTILNGALRYDATTGAGHTNTINVGETSGSNAARLLIGASGVTVSNRITVRSGSSGQKTIANLSAGTATFAGAMVLQTGVTFSNASGGSLTISGAVDFNSAQRTITVPGSQTATVSGVISGDSGNGLLKQGSGALRLAGANTYTGGTTIDTGTIMVVTGGDLGSGSDIYIASGAALTAEVSVTVASLREKGSGNSGTAQIGSGAIVTVNGADKGTYYMNTISGAGGLTYSASGTSTMRLFAANTYSGNTVINSGTLGLWAGGGIADSARIFIGTNAIWDVSTRSSALTLASGQGITVIASASGSPATLHTASSTGTLAMAASGSIVFGSYSSGGGAPLTISGNGSFSLASGNSVIVTNTGAALGAGSYKLISKGVSSSVGGTAPATVTVAGAGLTAGATASLTITSGELFLVVVSSDPDVLVLGNGVTITDGSTTPSAADHTDFGDALVIGGTLTRTYTITNSGNATLGIGNVTTSAVTGAASNFIVTAQPTASIAAGGTTTFQVQFNPSTSGVLTADVQFTNNVSGAKNPYSFRIQGTGTFVEVAVSGNGNNIASGSLTPAISNHTEFGSAGTESATLNRTFTITNSGNRAMTIGNVTTSGTHAADFIVVTQPGATLNPSNSTTIVVQFNPSAVGTRSATVSFSTTDDGFADGLTENPFTFAVGGFGVAPAITSAPVSLAFSSVLGSAPSAQNFHVTNSALGTMAYTVASNVTWLNLSANSGSVGAGAGQAHTAVPVVLAGQQVGTSNATITISSTTATNGPIAIPVSWTIGAVPDPSAATVQAEGAEHVRLFWTKDASYDVMIVHREGSASTAPAQGTAYNVGDSVGGGTVIYKGGGAYLDHVVKTNATHYYAFYSVNNHRYSSGLTGNGATREYPAHVIIEQFAYTSGVSLASLNGAAGWTNAWNHASGYGISTSVFSSISGYPDRAANVVTGTSVSAYREFAEVTTGKVYVAYQLRINSGSGYAGLSFFNNAAEQIFFGERGGVDNVFAVDGQGGNVVNGGALANDTDYTIIGMYDFENNQGKGLIYTNASQSVPANEPGAWHAEISDGDPTRINRIRIESGSGTIVTKWDEIRIARSWADLLSQIGVVATNYGIGNATNHVFDGQVASGAFPVMVALRSDAGVESVNTSPPFFIPNFDLFNPGGTQIVTDRNFTVFSYQDSGKTLIASNASHATVQPSAVTLGVYTGRWSAVSSNGLQAINISALSNNTPITFTVVDDDTTSPVAQDFRIFGSSGNATLSVAQLINGADWAITGLVRDVDSGINVNGTSVTQPDISPYFELWDSSGSLRLRQAFNAISFTNGGAHAALTPIGSTNNNTMVSAPLGTWTARVVVADADADRSDDRIIITNEFAFQVVAGDSTAGIGNMPTLLNITSTFGTVASPSPWPHLTVTNVGASPLIYNVEISYNSGFGWLTLLPTNGSIASTGGTQIHTGSVNTASMNPGTYEAVVAFNGNQTNGARYVTNRLTVIGYNAGEIVDAFTNSAGSVNGATGGSGWTNGWNASVTFAFSNNNLATPNNYPAAVGNKVCGNSVGADISARRHFAPFTEGKVFMAVAAQKSDGNSDGFFGVSFMNGSAEAAFAGKLFNDGNFGLDLGSNGGSQSGGFGANGTSAYLFIGMYDFDNDTFYVRAYNGGDTLPLTEPTWGASRQPTVAIASIDGVRVAAKDEGTVCFDEIRVANSWEALLNQFTTTPTLHATSMTFTNLAPNAMTVGWTPGNGLNRMVVAREGSAVSFVPTNGVGYSANNDFGTASDMGGGNKIVYNASGSSLPLTGLNPETRYYFAVFEYNGGGATASYFTNAGFLTGNRWTLSTEPASNATGLAAFTVSDSSISNTWTQAAGAPSASGYLILRSYAAVSDAPADGAGYTNGQHIGNSVVSLVTPGTAETLLHTGLASCSNFHFAIHSFRWNGSAAETYNYVTGAAPSASAETTCETPSIQASDIVFTLVGTNRIGLSWENGSGQGRLVVVRGTNAVNQNPVDGSTYTAAAGFGNGSHLGDGNFVVFNGTGAAVTVTNLFPGTTYHFRVYEFNGAGGGIDYNTTTTNGNPRSAAAASFGIVEDKFDYAAGNMSGANGGTGWTNAWGTLSGQIDVANGNFGAFGAYPADTGTRQGFLNSVTKRSAHRNFPARTSGKLYFAVKINLGSSVQNAYFGVNLLNGAASSGAGDNNVTGFFGKAFGVADNKLSLDHNGSVRTNKLDGSNAGYQFNSGAGNDYLMVAVYDFDENTFKVRAYTSTQLAHFDADRENAWLVEMDNVNIERIDGIEVIGNGLGNCYFDHIRIGPSWEEVMWNLPDNWHEDNGPTPSLVYIGTNYNASFYSQVITNLSDAELKSAGNIDFAVRWDSPVYGMFMQNTGTNHIGSPDGRVTPNWDPLAIGVATNQFGLDRFFTNVFGANGSLVATTYQFNAFNITNIDFSIQYFVTVSAETHPGGSTVTAPSGGDAVPVTRAITINEPLRFYVYDDDTNEPVRGATGMNVLVNEASVSFQEVGDVRRYFVTDGDLAVYGMDVSVKAYDAYSGLQRAAAGGVATNMNLSITNLVTSNISYFAASRSTSAANTTNTATSNLWSFADTLFDFDAVTDLWGGDGTEGQGRDLPVYASVPDNDDDRVDDQEVLDSELFGYIRLLDDDIAGPTMTTARVDNVSSENWTNLTSITLQWSQAVDDITGVAAHRYVAPAENTLEPTGTNSGTAVGGTTTSAVAAVVGQGVLTGYVFAVDADNDRANDAAMGNILTVTVKIDTNPPPRVAALRASDAAGGNLFDPNVDESSEIKVEWSTLASAEEAAGWRTSDQEPLSPWDTYVITYQEVSDTNGNPIANAITTVVDRTVAGWSNVLNAHTFTNLVLSNLNFDAYYQIAIQGRDAAGNISQLTNVIGNTDRFVVTQGVARAGLAASALWTGPTNELTFRDYDVLFVDGALGFRNTLSNQWNFMLFTNRPAMLDTGAVDRVRPGNLTGTTYRFYRVAKQDRWQTSNSPRVGSTEIYVSKAIALHPGENWYSMFSFPDPATTNEQEATVAHVFGTNLLPRTGSAGSSAKITWFGSTVSGDELGSNPTSIVWLSSSEGWRHQLGGSGSANDKRVPLHQGFMIELPPESNPTNLVLIGRLPTQSVVHVVSGAGAVLTNPTYHIISHAIPERISLVNLGITTNNGFRGGINIGQSDDIRILDNNTNSAGFGTGSVRAPKARIFWRTSDHTWRLSGSLASASGYIVEPDDAVIIVKRHATDLVWTNRPVNYSPPTKNFTP
jgi:autotransporter-associated beta strand protein